MKTKLTVAEFEENNTAKNEFHYQIFGFLTKDQENKIVSISESQGFNARFEEMSITTILTLSRIFGRFENKKPITGLKNEF